MKIRVFSILNLMVLCLVFFICLFPGILTTYDPNQINFSEKLQSPSPSHPFGTDEMGRDLMSRVLHGGRITIFSALLISCGSMAIAIIWAGISSYCGGWVDELMNRIVDGVLNIPSLFFALILISVLKPGMPGLIIALILIKWAGDAKLLRGHMLSLMKREFVTASISLGSPARRILAKDILPNSFFLVLTLFGMNFASSILSIAGLNFLGFGVQLPQAEWGALINHARPFLQTHPYLMFFPGLAILLIILSTLISIQLFSIRLQQEVRYL